MTKEDKQSFEYKKSHLTPDQLACTKDNRDKYSPIPQIPSDIGYRKSKDIGRAKQTGVFSNCLSNPAVPIGLGLTTIAILGMIRRSVQGDKLGAQKYMQCRIVAQFFTVTALVSLPDDYLIYPGHDYTGQTVTSVAEEKKLNPRLTMGVEKFVEFMKNLKLVYPKQIERSIPANKLCGIYENMDERLKKIVAVNSDAEPHHPNNCQQNCL